MKAAALALALLAASTGIAAAPDAGADRAQIAAIEQHWLAAIRHHDRHALENILAEGFVDINANGRMRNRGEAIAHASAPAGTTQTITRLRVRIYGDAAIATGINTVHSTIKGWTAEVAFSDVFARVDGRWRAVSAQETLRKAGAG